MQATSPKIRNPNKDIIYIVLFATAIFLLISFFLGLFHNYDKATFIYDDALSYQDAAKLLYTQGFKAHEVRPFGYSLLLGLPYLFNAGLQSVLSYSICLNYLFWLGSLVIIYKLGIKYLDQKYTLIYVAVFIGTITNIYMIFQTMSETAFLFFVLLAIWNVCAFATTRNVKNLSFALFCACYSATIRPINYYLALLFFLFCIIYLLWNKNIKYLLAAVVIFCCTILLQFQIMHQRFHEYKLSYIQNITAYYYVCAKANWQRSDKSVSFGTYVQQLQAQADSGLTNHPGDTYYKYTDSLYAAGIKNTIRTNKHMLVREYLKNIRENCTEGNVSILNLSTTKEGLYKKALVFAYQVTRYQNILLSLVLLTTAIAVFVKLLRSKFKITTALYPLLICLGVCLYYLLCSGISFWQADRFSFIYYPLIVFSALGIFKIFNNRPDKLISIANKK